MMKEKLKKVLKNQLLRILAVLLIVVVTGQEIGISMEMFALLDGLGAELFLLCFSVGIRLYIKMFFDSARTFRNAVRAFIERLDPYFFIPSRHQFVECPSISVHAIPGYISLYLFAICWPSITVDA